MVLMIKFINNFFSKPYTLDYAGDYYVNMKTVISNSKIFPKFSFENDPDGNIIVEDLSPPINHMRNEYRSEKVDVFTLRFKLLTSGVVSLGLIYALLENLNSEKYLSLLKKNLRRSLK